MTPDLPSRYAIILSSAGLFELERRRPERLFALLCHELGGFRYSLAGRLPRLKGSRRNRSWKRFGIAGLNSSSAPR